MALKKITSILNHIFIDGLSGMAQGLFATLIIGTIIEQIGSIIGSAVGSYLILIDGFCKALTGAGIGVGVAAKYKSPALVTVSAAVCGMVGAFAEKITLESFTKGSILFAGPGEPLGAFVAAFVGIGLGSLISGKTKVEIIVTPVVTILSGAAVELFSARRYRSL